MKPKFGLYVPQNLPVDMISALAENAEEAGYDSVWFYDHLLPYDGSPLNSPILEGWTLASYVAALTKRIRVGILVSNNGIRHPALLAKMISTLDTLSRGRVNIGIGAGWYKLEHESYGFDFPKLNVRISMLEEAIRLLKTMMTRADPVFDGKYYNLNHAFNFPRPLQKPHPPIWVGGRHESVLSVAAKLADYWNLAFYSGVSPEYFGELSNKLDALCRSFGRNPKSLSRTWHGLVLVAKDSSSLREKEVKAALTDFDRRSVIRGTAEECAEMLSKYVENGCSYFIMKFDRRTGTQEVREFMDSVGSAIY